jgi:dihydrofolate reductase
MRKLIVEEWISLDGYAADIKGATDFFPSTEQNRASDEDQLKFLDTIDIILLGRKTYELFAGFWPTVTTDKEILADKLNSIPKVVISGILKMAPWGNFPEAAVVSGGPVAVVNKLMQEKGKDIVIWGSISVVQELMKADLVDEYRVHVCPVRLGGGRSLFPENINSRELQLISSKVYDKTGVVFLKYAPKR